MVRQERPKPKVMGHFQPSSFIAFDLFVSDVFFFTLIDELIDCVYMYVYSCTYHGTRVRSEDNVWDPVLFFHHAGSRNKPRSLDLAPMISLAELSQGPQFRCFWKKPTSVGNWLLQ